MCWLKPVNPIPRYIGKRPNGHAVCQTVDDYLIGLFGTNPAGSEKPPAKPHYVLFCFILF